MLPNARLSDSITQVAPRDRPTQATVTFLASVEVRPDLISDLVGEMMIDLPLVEESLPVIVAPVSYQPRFGALRYRVKYWLRRYAQADDVHAEAHRRLWYVFQRNDLPHPAGQWSEGRARPRAIEPREAEALIGMAAPALDGDARSRLRESSDLLMFAANEYLVAPARTQGRGFLIIQGEAERDPEFETLQHAESGFELRRLGRTAAIRRIADELALHIGPYAEFAVGRAAKDAPNIVELCKAVSLEIAGAPEREAFLAAVCPPSTAPFGPGRWLEARRNAAGSLICGGGLRARREVILLAAPPSFVGNPAAFPALLGD